MTSTAFQEGPHFQDIEIYKGSYNFIYNTDTLFGLKCTPILHIEMVKHTDINEQISNRNVKQIKNNLMNRSELLISRVFTNGNSPMWAIPYKNEPLT